MLLDTVKSRESMDMSLPSLGTQLKRFAVQLFCLWMGLYGPPVFALQEIAGERQAAEARLQAEADEKAREQESIERRIAEHLGQSSAPSTAVPAKRPAPAAVSKTEVPSKRLAPPKETPTKRLAPISAAMASTVFGAVQEPTGRPTPPSPPSFDVSESLSTGTGPAALAKADLDSLPFLPSWNLISIPETPTVSSPSDVFSPIDGSYSRIWFYDACDASAEKWKVFDPTDPGSASLTTISPTQGLWLDATAAGSLPSTGELPATSSWQLCTGWNLIGFPAGQNRHIRTALQDIEGKYSMVYGYDPSDTEDPWAIHDVTVPDWANDLQIFEVGKGYWILVTEDVTLDIPNQGDVPTVAFTAPVDLSEVTEPTDLLGDVSSPLLDFWRVSTRLIGQTDWQELARGSQPRTAEKLATFDPTLLLNGLHELRLEAVDSLGRIVEDRISVVVDGQMKIGHFTLSFVDLQIPLSGLDIRIIRTYDSRDTRLGDFGVGWTLDIRQGFYQNNRPPGDGWQIPATSGPWGLPCSVVQETKSHLTTIRLSDQEVYRFRLVLKRPSTLIGGCIADAEFEWVDGPLPGTTLEILGNTEVFYPNNSDGVLDRHTQEPFVPDDVKLTTRDGRIFHLDLQDGVTHLEDLHGNTLEITPDGITHSSGRGVEFIRGADGKIEEIIDPRGKRNVYGYDGNNDLILHTDRAGADTSFTYRDHYLEDIHNAYGIRAVRTEYDDDGRMVKMVDASGREMLFDHDLAGRREVVTNRLGFTRVMEYDSRGNVTLEINENGEKTTRTYDRDLLRTEKNDLGHTTTYNYFAASNDLKSIKNPLDEATSFTYHALGLPETITDPLDHKTTNHYKSNGELEWTEDALEHRTHFGYNSRGELSSITDALDHVTSFKYDAYGNLEKETDALGHSTSYTYDDHGNRETSTTTRTLPNGELETLVTRYQYDDLDRAVTVTAPDGTFTKTVYDLLGRVTQQIDERGRTTIQEYDEQGRLAQVIYADGTHTRNVFDAEGRTVASVDQLGRITRYSYDPVGRLLTTTYPGPDEPTVTNEYDRAGRLVKVIDERGNPTRYVYDDAGRRTKVIDALNQETIYDYDDAGRLESVTDPRDFTTTYQYDDVGRQRFVISHDQSKVETVYDAVGRRREVWDQERKKTEYFYDDVGRLKSVKDALNQITSYDYDELGNFIAQTDANGHTTRFEYDALGRQITRILPDGAKEHFFYHIDGTLKVHQTFMGAVKKFTYDDLGRLLERKYSDGTVHSFTYTKTGRRATALDPRGLTLYKYDDRDRLKEKIDPTGHSLEYGYDVAGNRESLTAKIGNQTFTTSYTHDVLNRIETVTDPNGGVYTYQYNGNSQAEHLEYPNGVTTTWIYDSQSRLEDLITRDPVGQILQSYHYTMAKTGHRTQIDEHDGTVRAYDYDDLWRLTQDKVTNAGGLVYQEDFQYDPVGNRLLSNFQESSGPPLIQGYAYDSRDRLVQHNGQRVEWDRGGRLVADPEFEFSWNADSRLLSVQSSKQNSVANHMIYDFDGLLVQSTGEVGDRIRLVDKSRTRSQTVAVLDGSDPGWSVIGADHKLLSRSREGWRVFLHWDALGSIRLATNESGGVEGRNHRRAFGQLSTTEENESIPVDFAGGSEEGIPGLPYHRMRWYLPRAGIFVSSDRFPGLKASPRAGHPYSYASQDPVNLVDPSGYISVASGLVAAAVTVTVASFLLANYNSRSVTRRRPPTGREIANITSVRIAMENAWIESQPERDLDKWTKESHPAHEEGGWIYMNPDNGYVDVVRMVPGLNKNSIRTDNPPNRISENMVLVSFFHTHPFPPPIEGHPRENEGHPLLPTMQDVGNSTCYGVPGIIRAHDDIYMFLYPHRRRNDWRTHQYAYPVAQGRCGARREGHAETKDEAGYYVLP